MTNKYYNIQALVEIKAKSLEDAMEKIKSLRIPKRLKLKIIAMKYSGATKK